MQLVAPNMLESTPFATSVAKGSALWHSAQSGGHCPSLASALRMSGGVRATKLIVFPEWDNLVQDGSFGVASNVSIVSIN
ncbi:MAG TPA: hypothetical protein DDW73_10250 [Rhizobium sp.]|jgi:hypothetical protein|nr:hypothetical protein [Rhizobium sp.]